MLLDMYCVKCDLLLKSAYCPLCGVATIGGWIKCPYCWDTHHEMVHIRHKFCDSCGRPIQEEVDKHIKIEREKNEHNNQRD